MLNIYISFFHRCTIINFVELSMFYVILLVKNPPLRRFENYYQFCYLSYNPCDFLFHSSEKWRSVLHHITGKHKWTGNTKFHQCSHPPLTEEEQNDTKWLKQTSPAFKAVSEVVNNKNLLRGLRQLTRFCHTGDLEVFHNMLLKYCPKRQHFHYEGTIMSADYRLPGIQTLIYQQSHCLTSIFIG